MAQRTSIRDRFEAKVRRTTTCWLWTGSIDPDGYGRLWDGKRPALAHRVAYELFVGPVPDGMQLDHVKSRGCLHRHCVNPAHLEPVAQPVNIARGESFSAVNAVKTHCKNGHPYDDANTVYFSDGWRHCRACRAAAAERRNAARRR